MSSTNKTSSGLSQFIATDKPAWLTDYNNDMRTIDAALQNKANAGALPNIDNLFGNLSTETEGFFLDSNGWIRVFVLIKNTHNFIHAQTLFNLPVGFRPPVDIFIPCVCSGSTGRVAATAMFRANGNVTLVNISEGVSTTNELSICCAYPIQGYYSAR